MIAGRFHFERRLFAKIGCLSIPFGVGGSLLAVYIKGWIVGLCVFATSLLIFTGASIALEWFIKKRDRELENK